MKAAARRMVVCEMVRGSVKMEPWVAVGSDPSVVGAAADLRAHQGEGVAREGLADRSGASSASGDDLRDVLVPVELLRHVLQRTLAVGEQMHPATAELTRGAAHFLDP